MQPPLPLAAAAHPAAVRSLPRAHGPQRAKQLPDSVLRSSGIASTSGRGLHTGIRRCVASTNGQHPQAAAPQHVAAHEQGKQWRQHQQQQQQQQWQQQQQRQEQQQTNDASLLWSQVQELREVCKAQQEAITQQQAAIQQLQQHLQQQQHQQAGSGLLLPDGQGTLHQAASAPSQGGWSSNISPFAAQAQALQKYIPDRRARGLFDARFHSTRRGAIPNDFRVLPERIILVRHAESEGNVDNSHYTYTPDPQVSLTERGQQQAREAGVKIRQVMERASGTDYRLFFYTSPYKRSLQTYEGIRAEFASSQVAGCQEEVQLREQDFGNFQSEEGMRKEKLERVRFGRFFYRFPNGESGADVYDRITIFEDHLTRDINAGRFAHNTSLVLVTHGLALRIILMRWFHWRVDQFMKVYNPPNAEPIVMERIGPAGAGVRRGDILSPYEEAQSWLHTKSLYRLTPESISILKGCTTDMGCDIHLPPGVLKSLEEWDESDEEAGGNSPTHNRPLSYDEQMWS